MIRREARLIGGVLALTLLGAFVVFRWVRLDPNIGSLLPAAGEGAALRRYLSGFGGGDPGIVLLSGDDPAAVAAAAGIAAGEARGRASVSAVVADADDLVPRSTGEWLLLATPTERAELLAVFDEPRLTARAQGTRALLLAPGGSALKRVLAADPLRLGDILTASRSRRRPQAGGAGAALTTPDGKARLVLLLPRGNAFQSEDARRFNRDLEESAAAAAKTVGVTAKVTGGHAVSAAMEALIRRDLAVSALASLGLGMTVFLLLFRSPRVLAAVIPPLVAGTILTTLTALCFPRGLSAIAVAFASVVLGVGADSGVHLYAATQAAMRAGAEDPAQEARRRVGRPVLLAAITAGGIFACLAASSIEALRQLGLLAAVGEIVTALCLLAVTPALATWLERRGPREAVLAPAVLARASTSRRLRPLVWVTLVAAPLLVAAGLGARTDGPVVALRPESLPPLEVYRTIAATFGSDPEPPSIALVPGASGIDARARADAVYEALDARPDLVRSLDGLTAFFPAEATRERRCRELFDAAPTRAASLSRALAESGLSPTGFADAVSSVARPPCASPLPLPPGELARYVQGGPEALAVVSYLPAKGQAAAARTVVSMTDGPTEITGIGTLEPALASAVARDLPRVGLAALLVLAVALTAVLRRARHVAIALVVVVCELSLVLLAMRAAGVPLHVYDALVLPVLIGVTLDEVLFVLGAVGQATTSEGRAHALQEEAPLVATTALTTAAGFAALGLCRFEGLRHLGFVGAVGSVIGLLLALVVVPALLPAVAPPE